MKLTHYPKWWWQFLFQAEFEEVMAYLKDLTYIHTNISEKLPPTSEIYKTCVGIAYRYDEINTAPAAHQ